MSLVGNLVSLAYKYKIQKATFFSLIFAISCLIQKMEVRVDNYEYGLVIALSILIGLRIGAPIIRQHASRFMHLRYIFSFLWAYLDGKMRKVYLPKFTLGLKRRMHMNTRCSFSA